MDTAVRPQGIFETLGGLMKRRTFGALIFGDAFMPGGTALAAPPTEGDSLDPLWAVEQFRQELASSGTTIEEQLALYDEENGLSENPEASTYHAFQEAIDSAPESLNRAAPPVTPPPGGFVAAMLAVIVWFNLKGYKLSAELLNHSRGNHATTSTYRPKHGSRVAESTVTIGIGKGSATKGSGRYPNSGGVIQRDLYYAIHKFDWTRSGSTVTITDRYDYKIDSNWWKSIAGVAISTMAAAQRVGVLTPFVTTISVYIKR